jgi:hypothetical protein
MCSYGVLYPCMDVDERKPELLIELMKSLMMQPESVPQARSEG